MIDRSLFTAVRLPVRLKWIAMGWVVGEIVVFLALVKLIGFGGTVLLGLVTTVLGVLMLRRLGTDTLTSLRGAMDGRQPRQDGLVDGMIGALGAVLLIVPGFLANGVGLALAAPSVRRKAVGLFSPEGLVEGGRLRKASKDVIDLGPADWRAVDGP